MIEVLQPGALTTIQDLGRKGYEHYGIPPSGPLDPFLATIANRLVGNDPNAPLLEFALTGPTLRFQNECLVAFAGPPLSYLLNGEPAPMFRAFHVPQNATLQFEKMQGWFAYVAVGGGLKAAQTLRSASTYLAGNIGHRLQKGQMLSYGKGRSADSETDFYNEISNTMNVVRILPGIHCELFGADRDLLTQNEYMITPQSNRMGIRLEGSPITGASVRRSVPTLPGTVQINRSGQPMILGPEGPTTGGYPQIANLCSVAWTAIAFAGPGRSIRFEWTTRGEARRLLQAQQVWLNSIG